MFCVFLCTEGVVFSSLGSQQETDGTLQWANLRRTHKRVHRQQCSWERPGTVQCPGLVAMGHWPPPADLRGERQESFLMDRDPAREQAGHEEGTLGQSCELPWGRCWLCTFRCVQAEGHLPEPPSLEVCGQGGPLRDAQWDLRMMWWASLSHTHHHSSAGSAPGLRQCLGQLWSISPWFLLQLLPLPGQACAQLCDEGPCHFGTIITVGRKSKNDEGFILSF